MTRPEFEKRARVNYGSVHPPYESLCDFQMICHLHSVTECLHYVTECLHYVTECLHYVTECLQTVT